MWYHGSIIPVNVPPNGVGFVDITPLGLIPAGLEGGYTAKRLIGEARLGSTAVGPGNDINGAIGLYAGTRAGLLSPSNAVADLIDWWWNKPFSFQLGFAGDSFKVDIDIRSGRKIRGEDRTLIYTVANSLLSQQIRIYFAFRMWLSRS